MTKNPFKLLTLWWNWIWLLWIRSMNHHRNVISHSRPCSQQYKHAPKYLPFHFTYIFHKLSACSPFPVLLCVLSSAPHIATCVNILYITQFQLGCTVRNSLPLGSSYAPLSIPSFIHPLLWRHDHQYVSLQELFPSSHFSLSPTVCVHPSLSATLRLSQSVLLYILLADQNLCVVHWNSFTPLFSGQEKEIIHSLMLPFFLPFSVYTHILLLSI